MSRGRILRAAMIIAVSGLLLSAIGIVVKPERLYLSYLTAFAFALALPFGALFLLMIGNVTGAGWLPEFRPILSKIARTLPVFALLFLPVLLGLDELYPWVPPIDGLPVDVREKVHEKRTYLNIPFFIARAAVYFGVWTALALLLGHDSARQRAVSAIGLIALIFTGTFASFDWFMSLDPAWYSTIYGLSYISGAFVAALALVIIIGFALDSAGSRAQREDNAIDHYHGLGKLLLTAVLTWAYLGFSQLLIIWIGDLPREVAWYIPRIHTTWGMLGVALILGHFLLPTLLLLSREVKRRPAWLAGIAAWVLVMHYVDVYWLIVPALEPEGFAPHWLDLTSLGAVAGLGVAFGAWRWGAMESQSRHRAPVRQ